MHGNLGVASLMSWRKDIINECRLSRDIEHHTSPAMYDLTLTRELIRDSTDSRLEPMEHLRFGDLKFILKNGLKIRV